MPQRRPVAFCVLYLNWGNSGFSERYFLPGQSWEWVERRATALAQRRIAACCTGVKLIWGRIGFTDDPRLTQPIRAIGIHSNGYFGAAREGPNEPYTRLHVRFETGAGRWSNRLIGAVPDSVVRACDFVGELPHFGRGEELPAADDLNSGWFDQFGAFVAFVRDNTIHAWKVNGSEGGWYDTARWDTALFRQVTTRNTGRDFLRVSWESARTKPAASPGIDPPTDAAAAFTPCGAAVMVTRSAYSRPCQWYVNGPLGRIRYYFVPEENEILQGRNRFWPYSQDLAIVNADRTGERTNAAYKWDRGKRRNILTGEHPHGTPEDFAGETRLPWTPSTPTPAASFPGCDFPFGPPEIDGGAAALIIEADGAELNAAAGLLLEADGAELDAAAGLLLDAEGEELDAGVALLFSGGGSPETGDGEGEDELCCPSQFTVELTGIEDYFEDPEICHCVDFNGVFTLNRIDCDHWISEPFACECMGGSEFWYEIEKVEDYLGGGPALKVWLRAEDDEFIWLSGPPMWWASIGEWNCLDPLDCTGGGLNECVWGDGHITVTPVYS